MAVHTTRTCGNHLTVSYLLSRRQKKTAHLYLWLWEDMKAGERPQERQ